MTDQATITTLVSDLKAWAQQNAPGIIFNPPADLAAIDHFRNLSSLNLPDAITEMLLFANGESQKSAGLIGNWRLMSIQEIQAAWGWLAALAAKGAFDEQSPLPSPYLYHTWWHRAWVPIVSSDTGDYVCLDTDPPESQRAGQLLLFLQDQPERYLIAANLAAWLAQIKADFDAGLYAYDEENGFNSEALMWSALEGKHHFDQIPGKIIAEENRNNENTP